MRIDASLYKLKAKGALNTLTNTRVRQGALIRCLFEDAFGYADVHPWIELGDLPLQKQLDKLSKGVLTPLTERSLYFAKLDAEARKRSVSLFEGLQIPQSHGFVTEEIPEGFSLFKVKASFEKIELIKKLPGKMRLDFNCKLNEEHFQKFLKEIPNEQIDFCEDPFPYDKKAWEGFAIPLACDLGSEQAIGTVHTLIIKPAVQNIEPFLKTKQKLVVTSYMDHPLGQSAAAYIAAKYADRLEPCGLLTHLLYEKSSFSEELSTENAYLKPAQGFGFGFDDSLRKINWRSLLLF